MTRQRVTRQRLSASTYVELVRSLAATTLSSAIMGVLFIVTAWVCAQRTPNIALAAFAVLGSIIAIGRFAATLLLRPTMSAANVDADSARRGERIFGGIYLAFAAAFGAFAAACFALCPYDEHMAIAALVVGYAAGVAAGISLRPWIAVPAVLISVTPAIFACLFIGDVAHLLLAFLLSTLMAGGITSMVGRYKAAVEMIEMRQLFASLARQDPLTGLANRFALQDLFVAATATFGRRAIFLHCLDLDRFKPVNDVHGHAVGDLLLQAVAERLKRLVRPDDLAVRLGGDEFAVLQTGVQHSDEAELMARRIGRVLAEPYAIRGHRIIIGVSVGSAAGKENGADLKQLLSAADDSLYDAKNAGRGARALAG